MHLGKRMLRAGAWATEVKGGFRIWCAPGSCPKRVHVHHSVLVCAARAPGTSQRDVCSLPLIPESSAWRKVISQSVPCHPSHRQPSALLLDSVSTVSARKALCAFYSIRGTSSPFKGQFSQRGFSADGVLILPLLCPGTVWNIGAGPASYCRKPFSLPDSPLPYSARQSFLLGSFKWRVVARHLFQSPQQFLRCWKAQHHTVLVGEDCPARPNTQKTFSWWCD